LALDISEIHAVAVAADHVHSRFVLIVSVPVAPAAGTVVIELDTVTEHLLPVGDDKTTLNCVSRVLADENRRRQMRDAGRGLYDGVFDLRRTVAALTSGAPASGRAA